MKIGIDLGGSHIAIGVVNDNGIIVEKVEKRILNKEKEEIEDTIETYIIENVKDMKQKYEISQIGIAIPGTVNEKEIVKSVNLGIENYSIVEQLEKILQIPIQIRNDAKCAAMAEDKYGTLKTYKRSIFLTLGTGIGGAVIINHQLLETGNLPGCEFGHIIIEKEGRQCKCGKKGCWEKYASMKSLKDNLRKELGLTELTRGQELLEMIKQNEQKEEQKKDRRIDKIVEEYIEYLSIGISNLINIFEPEAVGIGGSFVFFQDIFLDKIKKKIQEENLLFNNRDEIIIEPAILNNDAGIIGSILGTGTN